VKGEKTMANNDEGISLEDENNSEERIKTQFDARAIYVKLLGMRINELQLLMYKDEHVSISRALFNLFTLVRPFVPKLESEAVHKRLNTLYKYIHNNQSNPSANLRYAITSLENSLASDIVMLGKDLLLPSGVDDDSDRFDKFFNR